MWPMLTTAWLLQDATQRSLAHTSGSHSWLHRKITRGLRKKTPMFVPPASPTETGFLGPEYINSNADLFVFPCLSSGINVIQVSIFKA